jgi:Xaa-Pro aminopeptidase
MVEFGADYPAFLVVRSGVEGGFMLNKFATDRIIEAGDLVSLDVGCAYLEYYSDTIRTASVGRPSTQTLAIHDVAMRVNAEVRAAIRPGITIDELDQVRQRAIEQAGVPAAWDGIGHMIGSSVHELPRLGRGEQTVLEPGMVFSVEPGVLAPDGQLFVVEDIVVVTEMGHRDLTHSRREITVVGA